MTATVATDLVFKPAGPMPIGRILRAYLADARYEFMQTLRAPAFAFPFLVLPAAAVLLVRRADRRAVARFGLRNEPASSRTI